MYTSVVKSLGGGGPLSHKQGSLIHQFGVWLGDLKIRLVFIYSMSGPNIKKNTFINII
jgi:hypothetical protein